MSTDLHLSPDYLMPQLLENSWLFSLFTNLMEHFVMLPIVLVYLQKSIGKYKSQNDTKPISLNCYSFTVLNGEAAH
jgi:hypothetical protein